MKITKVTPAINGGTIWSGGAVSDRQHYDLVRRSGRSPKTHVQISAHVS